MIKHFISSFAITLFSITGVLNAVDYDIQDIGTLHTRESAPIAINSKGQILGWYNINGTKEGKHFFVRERSGEFHELPTKENGVGWEIDWRFLTDDEKAYGTNYEANANFAVLYMWDRKNGTVKLGNLPGKEISAINSLGQVLIKSIKEVENGKTITRPVIWKNGAITKLKGVEGDLGIESEESYGLAMNNKGEVVGSSIAYLSYKNDIYKQTHAVKWVNGQVIDLHKEVPKRESTSATAINDLGDVVIEDYLVRADGKKFNDGHYRDAKPNNSKYFFTKSWVLDRSGKVSSMAGTVNSKLNNDYDSIWMHYQRLVGINDSDEVIGVGKTIYGENHIMLLTPIAEKK